MKSYETEEKRTENRERELYYQRIGEHVFRFRKSLSMNQADLAERTGLSKATISSIENGSPTESYNTHILARALDKPQCSLIYGYDESKYVRELLMKIQTLPPEQQKFACVMIADLIAELKKLNL